MSPTRGSQKLSLNENSNGDIEMTANIGTIDRVIRIIFGIFLLVVPFVTGWAIFASSTATIIAVLAGAVMLATSSMRFCPLYRIIGVRTCKL
jgi:uncharacterized membrane protein